MSTVPKALLTEHEYLRRERAAEFKSEFYRGETFAMAGASFGHTLICSNLVGRLQQLLRGRNCTVHQSDLRVKVQASGLYTYPDVVVVCGEPQFIDDVQDTLLNLKVLIEVLSESTEAYDRGVKGRMYREIPSLDEYVVVSQMEPFVETLLRQPEGAWLQRSAGSLEGELHLESLGVRIPLSEIYRQVEFPPPRLRPDFPPRAR